MLKQYLFNSGGVKLHFVDWGGSGRPVLLLAGLGDTAQIYRGLGPRLAKRFKVVGLTRRGHGRSDQPDAGYDLDTLVEDVRHFLDTLGIQKAILVGHSFAGVEMPLFAMRHPHRVEAIVYLDAIFPKLDREPDLSGNPVWSVLPSRPATGDLASVETYLAYYKRVRPDKARIWCEAIEADLMEFATITGDGGIEDRRDDELMNRILEKAWSSQNPVYDQVAAPMLAVVPDGDFYPGVPLDATDELQRAADRYWRERQLPWIQERTDAFRRAVPTARVVELDSPHHHIYVAKESETLKAIDGFLA